MNKKYKENLIYIPTDLVGNGIIDSIRKEFDLGTKIKPDVDLALLNKLLFGGESEIKFEKLNLIDETKKLYEFRVENFAGDKAVQQFKKELEAKGFSKPAAAFLIFVKIAEAATKLVAEPIFDKDLFFDVSFPAGRIVDESFFLPADATEEEIAESKQAENIPHFFYKIRSYYKKYIKDDPYQRFQGNTSQNSDFVPSMYRIVESSFFQPDGKTLNEIGKDANYSLYESKGLNHVVFYDLDSYNTFLQGCLDITEDRLRSVATYKEQAPYVSIEKQIEDLRDFVPFYSRTEFTTEKNSMSGFSFVNFLNSPQIAPFFQQFLGLYTDLVENPDKYEGASWLDSSEEFSVFSQETGEQVETFNTKVIRAKELAKDADFLNFELSKGTNQEKCSNIQKKLSSLLFEKKVTELIVDTLGDKEDFWLNANYSEPVCYRVTKTDKFTGKVSHWIVPNFPSLQNIQVFDTNLRFNEGADATYEVFALRATVAVDYLYKVPESALEGVKDAIDLVGQNIILEPAAEGTNDLPDLAFRVEARPSVNFIEVPFFSQDGILVYDSAPAAPNLQLFAYRQTDNLMTVLFAGFNDQYRAKRQNILLEDNEANNKAEQYARQFYSFYKDELYYKSESEDAEFFELFVTDKQPKKYEDFATATKISILNTSDPVEIAKAKDNNQPVGSSYTLNIEPNKDYWITGRVKDFNGNVSNPSAVFRFRIINDDGYINPIIKLFSFEDQLLPKEVSPSDSFAKSVYIAAGPQHTSPSVENGQITAGLGTESPFGKTYKVRIKSKKTNKKFDINVHFEMQTKVINSEKELPSGFEYDEIPLEGGDIVIITEDSAEP